MVTVVQDPLLGSYTSTTQFSPLLQAIQRARTSRIGANVEGEQKALSGLQNQMGEMRQGNVQASALSQPYVNAGVSGLQQAANLSGGFNQQQYDQFLQNDPVLNSIIKSGLRTAQQGQSAAGERFSGASQLELQQLGQEAANKYIGDIFGRSMEQAKLGSQFSAEQANREFNLGGQLGGVQAAIGDVGGEAALARGDINALSDIDYAKAQVAQSTVSGLRPGQVIGRDQLQYQAPAAGTITEAPSSMSGFDIFEAQKAKAAAGGGGGGGAGQPGGVTGGTSSGSYSGLKGASGGAGGKGTLTDAEGNKYTVDNDGKITKVPAGTEGSFDTLNKAAGSFAGQLSGIVGADSFGGGSGSSNVGADNIPAYLKSSAAPDYLFQPRDHLSGLGAAANKAGSNMMTNFQSKNPKSGVTKHTFPDGTVKAWTEIGPGQWKWI